MKEYREFCKLTFNGRYHNYTFNASSGHGGPSCADE